MNIGLNVSIDNANNITKANDIEFFAVWEHIEESEEQDEGIRHSIECTIWQCRGEPNHFPERLLPYGGRCHTFQFRIESLDENGEVLDLLEAEDPGAGGIHDLVEYVPVKWRLEAEQAVAAWLKNRPSAGEQVR